MLEKPDNLRMTETSRTSPAEHPTPVRKQHDRGSGWHNVLCCPFCESDRVELLAAQIATAETPTRHVTVERTGRTTVDEHACPTRRAPETTRRPRVAITYRCNAGHAWAAVQTFHLGQTFTFRAEPTLPFA